MKSNLLLIIMIIIMIFLFTIPIAAPVDWSNDPATDIAQTGWFIVPTLSGFYNVEDWEVMVCMQETYKKDDVPRESSTMMGKAASLYPGMISSATAFVDKGVADPEDAAKTSNLYTVCWGVFIVEVGTTMEYKVMLRNTEGDQLEVASSTASYGAESAGCEDIYDLKLYTQVYLILKDGPTPPNSVIEKESD